jgi:hypothetical protein
MLLTATTKYVDYGSGSTRSKDRTAYNSITKESTSGTGT